MATKTISYSELDTFRQCPLKHELAYRQRWTPDTVAAPLSRGKLFHAVLEYWYTHLQQAQRGEAGEGEVGEWMQLVRESAVEQYLWTPESWREPVVGEDGEETPWQPMSPVRFAEVWRKPDYLQTEQQELVQWMLDGYFDHYGTGDFGRWKIRDVEHRVEEWLPNRKGNRSTFKLKGFVDLIVEDNELGGLWIVDHKTCKNLPKEKDLDFDDQMAIYIYLLRRRGLDVRGAIYNAVRTWKLKREMTADERFVRRITVRSDEELRVMALEALETMRDAYRKREIQAPRAPDPDRCGWRCPFTEVCLSGRGKGDGYVTPDLLQDYGFQIDESRR